VDAAELQSVGSFFGFRRVARAAGELLARGSALQM